MPRLRTQDGVQLYYEEAGQGPAIVFVHEFGGDWRSWEPQLRHFSRGFRCISYSARGYLPSDIPEGPAQYAHQRIRDDLRDVLDALGIAQAHLVGCSMGAYAVLQFGIAYCTSAAPSRAHSLTLLGCGSGAHPAAHQGFREEAVALAQSIRQHGMPRFAATWGHGPTRIQWRDKDPRGFAEFERQLAEHSPAGSAHTMEGYLGTRPSLYALTEEMAKIAVPMLVVVGDEDEPCLETSLLIKRAVPMAGLAMLPRTGHALNLEEPLRFNQLLEEFLQGVALGRWKARDPAARPALVWGPGGRPSSP